MLRSLGAPEERRIAANDQIKNCKLRHNQSPLDLLDYLRGCWEELGETNEERKKLDFIGCLSQPLRLHLQSITPDLKRTLADTAFQASTAHRAHRKGNSGNLQDNKDTKSTSSSIKREGAQETPRKTKKFRKRGSGSNNASSSSTSTKDAKLDVTCYHCGKRGHIKPNCRNLDKPATYVPRGTGSGPSKPNESGKGPGRPGS
jgi:hypothetical protein